MSTAQTARAQNPQLTSRELAKAIREQNSRRGKAGQKKSEPAGRQRSAKQRNAAASDASWKVGASETARGQTLTGTMIDRTNATTGNDQSTCRHITGTEYMGAEIFRDFCQTEPPMTPMRGTTTTTSRGNSVSGNRVGRSQKLTGNEAGTCKKVTGSEYLSAEEHQEYCGTKGSATPAKVTSSHTAKGERVTGNPEARSQRATGAEVGSNRLLTGTQYMSASEPESRAPAKVGSSQTLRGGNVTGSMVGRSAKMTGDEQGGCQRVTGDDYLGQEHFQVFCKTQLEANDQKVGASQTFNDRQVTGTMTGRGAQVTGDEPGTCKTVTGTPYAGVEQYDNFCSPMEKQLQTQRTQAPRTPSEAAPSTDAQIAPARKRIGADQDALEAVSGTSSPRDEQQKLACAAEPATPESPDFPQMLNSRPPLEGAPTANSSDRVPTAMVTGSSYGQGKITGPFGMATDKVTGTDEARFGHQNTTSPASAAPTERESSSGTTSAPKITGEGMAAGGRITGDDWERGERVTGTEGRSVLSRNPTRRGGPMSAMAPTQMSNRNAEIEQPVSKVTGSSGNTAKGALVTYSGGARG
jgi:hypothetical protein